jgi:hypothetical protein
MSRARPDASAFDAATVKSDTWAAVGQKRTDADRSGLRRTVSDGYGLKGIIPDKCGQCRTSGETASELRSGIFGDLLGIGT